MESKIIIDIKEDGDPYIYIDFKATDDLRDKVLGRFLVRSGGFNIEPNPRPIYLKLGILWYDQQLNRCQATIENTPPVINAE